MYVTSFQFGPMLCPIGYGPHRPRMNGRMNLPLCCVVKNSLPIRGIDRRAPCNYVLFTPYHAPAPSKNGRNENVKKSRQRGAIEAPLSSSTLHRRYSSTNVKKSDCMSLIEEIQLIVKQKLNK